MFSQFQFFIRQMALKRLNIFVHHHEDVNEKVKRLVDHIVKDAEYKNNLLLERLNTRVNELIVERKYMENLKMELKQREVRFHEMHLMMEEIFEELKQQKLLYKWLRQENKHLQELPQTDLAMQGTSVWHL